MKKSEENLEKKDQNDLKISGLLKNALSDKKEQNSTNIQPTISSIVAQIEKDDSKIEESDHRPSDIVSASPNSTAHQTPSELSKISANNEDSIISKNSSKKSIKSTNDGDGLPEELKGKTFSTESLKAQADTKDGIEEVITNKLEKMEENVDESKEKEASNKSDIKEKSTESIKSDKSKKKRKKKESDKENSKDENDNEKKDSESPKKRKKKRRSSSQSNKSADKDKEKTDEESKDESKKDGESKHHKKKRRKSSSGSHRSENKSKESLVDENSGKKHRKRKHRSSNASTRSEDKSRDTYDNESKDASTKSGDAEQFEEGRKSKLSNASNKSRESIDEKSKNDEKESKSNISNESSKINEKEKKTSDSDSEKKKEKKERRDSSSSSSSSKSSHKEDEKKEDEKHDSDHKEPEPEPEPEPQQEPENPEPEEKTVLPPLPLSSRTEPEYTEDELEKELQRFLKTNRVPPFNMIKQIQQHISRRRVDAIVNCQYEEGEKMNEAQRKLKLALEKQRQQDDAMYEERTIEDRLKEARQELKEAQREKEEALERIEDRQYEKKEELRIEHTKELEKFKEFWQDPSSFHEYNKPSAQLLNLRAQERTHALSGDFTNAKLIKKRADKLEKEETERGQQKATEGMKIQLHAIEARQQKEDEGLDRLTHRLMLQATVRLDANIRPIEMAVKKLERMKEQPSCPKRQVIVSRSALRTAREKDLIATDDSPPVQTPRTMRKLANVRSSARPNTLGLKGVDAGRYIRIPKKTESPRKAREMERERKRKSNDF